MSKRNISSLELAALVRELQFLVRGKIPHIYHQEERGLLMQFHIVNEGKQLLKIIPGKFICLTKIKETGLRQSGFCMLLRKYLDNAFVKDIYQKDSERIVIFELEKKEKFLLIIELFSKGNIILCDEKYQIIGVLDKQIWGTRTVQPGEKYMFPSGDINWMNLSEKEFFNIINRSEKKNLATTLATEVGLGGVYAEELCLRAGVNKDLISKEVGEKGGKKLYGGLKEFVKLIQKPKGYVYAEQIAPFALSSGLLIKEMDTYNEAIDTLNPFQKASPYEKRIKALDHTINEQEEAIKKQEEAIIFNTKKGELIYERYAALQKLLEIVKELRKNRDWGEVAAELKKEKKIAKIDLKNKKIVIDL
ncbi:NFACT family protein [Candidatus Woesearchaeota archaeon]|nr:NFACT family protein [Candidatus Woesearchaeota archaeon]